MHTGRTKVSSAQGVEKRGLGGVDWRGEWGGDGVGLGGSDLGKGGFSGSSASQTPSGSDPPVWINADLCQRHCLTRCGCWGLPWGKETNVPLP